LAAHLIPPCPHAELFNGPGRAWLARQVLPDDEGAAIERHLRELDRLGEDLATLDRDIRVAVVDQLAVRRLLTIAGMNVTVAAGLVADLDMFDTEDLSFTPQAVHAVQISWRGRKDDAAIREVRSKVRSDAATADGATRTLTSSYLYYHDVFEEDPDVESTLSQ
jgi:hypothetical protein